MVVINWFETILKGSIGGIIAAFSYLFGGMDTMLETLLLLMFVDFITGYISGAYLGKLSSKISYKGIAKKFLILVIVVVCHRLDQLGMEQIIQEILGFEIQSPARTLIIFFYLGNEGLSIVENVGKVVALPSWLKKMFEVLKDRGQGGNK